ncbi:hypothetical protein SAMN05660236_2349 [Ohtaekwangia koreensis]|uniref:Uncharacterized protein n=1 Tax=Ohtaekwangia koreensis TaxID=688867 RepID=A0A1T5KM14_9BACT|nr:hypothetical protein SAMN05660236_2349 [Ohtaekwangia koreensis]
MQKKLNLKSFNLYEFLKHQNTHGFSLSFFLADRHTYKNAHVNFPFRTFSYGNSFVSTNPITKKTYEQIVLGPGRVTHIEHHEFLLSN